MGLVEGEIMGFGAVCKENDDITYFFRSHDNLWARGGNFGNGRWDRKCVV